MLRRVDVEDAGRATQGTVAAASPDPIVPAVAEADFESALPRDHPRWVKDAIAMSARAREIVGRLRPAAIRVLSLWDHRLRCIVIGDRRVRVDQSGSYRADP